MPFDGNGNYTAPVGTTAVPGAVIDAAVFNALVSDLQTALTLCLKKDGQSAASANLPMGSNKLTGLSAGTTAGDSVRFEQLYALPKGTYTPVQTVAFAATLTIDAALSNVFEIGALTANVSSFTISTPVGGQTLNIRFIQDATGGRSVAVPAGANVAGSIDLTASKVSWLFLVYSTAGARWEGIWNPLP